SDTLQNIWSAVIPAQVSGSEVQYYIKARSNSGKEQVRPIVAPKGYFNFRIKEQLINQPPTTTIIYPPDQSVFSIDLANVTLQLDAEDADGTVQHLVVYINSDSIATINTLPYTYDWQFPNEGEYEIRVKATDNDGAETWSTPVHISVEGTTGFGNVVNANVRFFPNPVEDVLWIRNDDHEVAKLFVTDLIGQSLSIPKVFQEEQYGLDFSLVAPGIYLIKSIVDGHFTCNQVVKR
ncbi:MAG: Ig-like domain-containing protein, partial [Saprospiraceae bacterium]